MIVKFIITVTDEAQAAPERFIPEIERSLGQCGCGNFQYHPATGVIVADFPEGLTQTFAKLGTSLHASYNWQPTGRRKIIAEDVQVFAYLIHHCSLDMNDDGSLPTERIKALWNWLYEAGISSRPYDPHRYTAIRNGFSAMELLNWTDHHYIVGLNRLVNGRVANS